MFFFLEKNQTETLHEDSDDFNFLIFCLCGFANKGEILCANMKF